MRYSHEETSQPQNIEGSFEQMYDSACVRACVRAWRVCVCVCVGVCLYDGVHSIVCAQHGVLACWNAS